MKVLIREESLIVKLPLEKPRPSRSSGKTEVIASTHGFRPTGVSFRGEEVYLAANACIYKRQIGTPKRAKRARQTAKTDERVRR